jgi:hypothetical protein
MALKTIKASGGDYTSLSAWEATLAATLTSTELAECYNFALSDDVAISGSVTSATNYIRIYTPLAERHDGRSRAVSGTGFRISDSTGAGTIRHGANSHVRYEGLEIEQTGSSNTLQINNTLSSGSDIRVEKCLIHDTLTGTGYTISAIAANLNLTLRNNIVYGNQRSMDTRGATSALCENSTFWRHQAQLGLVSGTELSCKNTYSGHAGAASDDFWSGGSPTGNNNASSDTTATARFTSSVNSVAGSAVFTSVTAGSEDFSLKTGTNALVDAGATLGTVTDDLIGTTRPQGASYDIGAFERIVSSAPTGTFVASLDGVTMAASGQSINVGSFSATLAGVTLAASGLVGPPPSGTFSASLGNVVMAATGTINDVGAFATTLQGCTMLATGTVAPHATGTFAGTMGDIVMSATGYVGIPPTPHGLFQRLPKNPRHVQNLP